MVDEKGSFPFRESGFMSMENGINSGFGIAHRVAKDSDGGGLGLKLQRIESFPYRQTRMMMMPHHQHHHHRPFSSSQGGAGGDHGPTCNNLGRPRSDIYDVAGAATSGGAAVVRPLQPFDISSTTTATTTTSAAAAHTTFKSPGGMAASLGFPFTFAQWRELERQAMIYKYMMASVPVPPDLLMPVPINLSDPNVSSHSPLGGGSSIFNLRFANGSVDPEPGRCRRTDGKKWRCSRDVAPTQKYCERHMHRGRPRSRKPVEVKSRLHHALPSATPADPCVSKPKLNRNASSYPYLKNTTQPYNQAFGFLDKFSEKDSLLEPVVSASSYREPRGLDWLMKEGTVSVTAPDQQLQHLMQTKIGLGSESSYCEANACVFPQQYEEVALNLNEYRDFGVNADKQQSEDCSLFLNPNVLSSAKTQSENPRGFIDAWSNSVTDDSAAAAAAAARATAPATANESSVSSNMKLSLSNLTLSMAMAGGELIDEKMGQFESGLHLIDSDRNGGNKLQPSSWLSSVPWAPTPGGPLAEVLLPSTVVPSGATSNPASPLGNHCDTGSPPATSVSSPSGVLQKTLVSLSDSSESSSPTLATSLAKPENALLWLSRSKLASSS